MFRAFVVLCRKRDLFGREVLAMDGTRLKAMLSQLNVSGESQISLTDPDARAMVTGQKTTVGYNAQAAVDAKHKLIVEQHVTNAATDMGLLALTAGAAREALGVERIDAVADMGYYKGEDIEACEANGITPYVARPERGSAIANGRFPKALAYNLRRATTIIGTPDMIRAVSA